MASIDAGVLPCVATERRVKRKCCYVMWPGAQFSRVLAVCQGYPANVPLLWAGIDRQKKPIGVRVLAPTAVSYANIPPLFMAKQTPITMPEDMPSQSRNGAAGDPNA